MEPKYRKIRIWLISLALVLAVYLAYTRLQRMPRDISIDRAGGTVSVVTTVDPNDPAAKFGKVGRNTEVGTVKMARYIDGNQEFGFERLLHRAGDEWEIEKPYINVHRPTFTCYMTADTGQVRVESGTGVSLSPKDATLSGNVTIHVVPEPNSSIQECFIYFDYVDFISEDSQFRTDGPVTFVSANARLVGRGLELAYNTDLDRLEILRIPHLQSLRLKSPTSSPQRPSQPADSLTGSTSSEVPVQTESLPAEQGDSDGPYSRAAAEPNHLDPNRLYRCVLTDNVIIDTPKQLIFADRISINNILFSPPGAGRSAQTEPESDRASAFSTDSNTTPAVVGGAVLADADANMVPVARAEEELFVQNPNDVIVTCDGSILVTPMDSVLKPEPVESKVDRYRPFEDLRGRATFVARTVDYCVRENRAVLRGDVLCKLVQFTPELYQKYTLSAPELIVSLWLDRNKPAGRFDTGLKHLTARGGVVQLSTIKRNGQQLLGGVELKCLRFDYDASRQLCTARGPDGLVKVDNSNITQSQRSFDGRFGLQKRCYAIVEGFDTLQYFLDQNRMVADGGTKQIHIGYVPVNQRAYGQPVNATAGRIVAELVSTEAGQLDITTLHASNGITYQEQSDDTGRRRSGSIQFVGSDFLYDMKRSLITAWGNNSQSCFLNGVAVDGIEYNLATGTIKNKIVGPSTWSAK